MKRRNPVSYKDRIEIGKEVKWFLVPAVSQKQGIMCIGLGKVLNLHCVCSLVHCPLVYRVTEEVEQVA